MGLFFAYVLKSAVCLSAFYLFHRWLLSRDTFHRFNRWALLSVLALSLLLPVLKVSFFQSTEIHRTVLTIEELLMMADLFGTSGEVATTATESAFPWVEGLVLLYFIGVAVFVIRFVWSLTQILLLLKRCEKRRLEHGITLYLHDEKIAPFSWMKAIVLSRTDFEESGREILIHEQAHIAKRHSLDLLLADGCICVQWFNPGAWLLKRELQNIHEYQADEQVLNEGVNIKKYQLLLIKKAVGTRLYSMANSFNHSKLKKRITMMSKEKSSPWARLKYLYVLPLVSIAVTAFARPEVAETLNDLSTLKVTTLNEMIEQPQVKISETVVKDTVKVQRKRTEKVVTQLPDEMPRFEGGPSALMEFIHSNFKRPENKEYENKRVIVQFVVEKDGRVTNPTVIRSVAPEVDQEALRVVRMMPNWIPAVQDGKSVTTKYTVPFSCSSKEKVCSIKATLTSGKVTVTSSDQSAEGKRLIIIDGKEISETDLESIDASTIASMSVLKGKSAVATYGEKGKNGVIVLTTGPKKDHSTALGGKKVDGNRTSDSDGVAEMILIEGVVKDASGNPVIGAAVMVSGKTMGTVTDTNGQFKLRAPKDAEIKASYIGMKSALKVASAKMAFKLEQE